MNIEAILGELVKERNRVNAAIAALSSAKGLGEGALRRVGRPRGPMSEETKQKMRDSWAKRRKLRANTSKG